MYAFLWTPNIINNIGLEKGKIFQKCILLFYTVVLQVADKALECRKFGNFRKNFIFENSIKRHTCTCETKNSQLVHELPT